MRSSSVSKGAMKKRTAMSSSPQNRFSHPRRLGEHAIRLTFESPGYGTLNGPRARALFRWRVNAPRGRGSVDAPAYWGRGYLTPNLRRRPSAAKPSMTKAPPNHTSEPVLAPVWASMSAPRVEPLAFSIGSRAPAVPPAAPAISCCPTTPASSPVTTRPPWVVSALPTVAPACPLPGAVGVTPSPESTDVPGAVGSVDPLGSDGSTGVF